MTKIIAVDAGHGHNTPGRKCDKRYDPNQTHEWDLNNRVANYEIEYLKEYDVQIIRLDDPSGKKDISLATRTNKANANRCDFVISNHHNGGNGNGLESYYDKGVVENSIEYQMYKIIHNEAIKATGQRNRGLRSSAQSAPGDLAILRDTKMPAMLIEAGFMDNAIDTPKIITEEFARKYARGVVNGSVKILNLGVVKEQNENYQGNSIIDYLKSINVDSSFTNRKSLALQNGIVGYTGTAMQNLQLLGALKNQNKTGFYPVMNSTSIVDALKSFDVDTSFAFRKQIANANGITHYLGTSEQNMALLQLLRQGKLKRP